MAESTARYGALFRVISEASSVPNQFHLLFPATAFFILHNANIKSMAKILHLTIIHGIADLISMLLRRSDEIQHTDWNLSKLTTGCGDGAKCMRSLLTFLTETQSIISFAEVC